MKYYSEILRKTFDTIEALETAETEEKKRVVAKQKEEDARAEEIKAAKEAVEKAKEEYLFSLKICRENLSRLSEAERKLTDLEKKYNSPTTPRSKYSDDWMIGDLYTFLRKFL